MTKYPKNRLNFYSCLDDDDDYKVTTRTVEHKLAVKNKGKETWGAGGTISPQKFLEILRLAFSIQNIS